MDHISFLGQKVSIPAAQASYLWMYREMDVARLVHAVCSISTRAVCWYTLLWAVSLRVLIKCDNFRPIYCVNPRISEQDLV